MKNSFIYVKRLILLYIFIFIWYCAPQKKFIESNFSFPMIQKKNLGETFTLKKLPHQTRYIVLNLFAPNCPPCIAELPEIKKIHENSKKRKDIFFIALGSTLDAINPQTPKETSDLLSEINQFIEQHFIQYPVYIANSKILQSFKVTGFPETFIFTRSPKETNLTLIRKFVSAINFDEVNNYLKY